MADDEKSGIRQEVIDAIRAANERFGMDAAAKIVRERYPEIPRATWYRFLKAASSTPTERAVDVAKKAAKHLPAAPSPAYVLDKPAEARRNIDFMTRLEGLYNDAELLREFALSKGYDVDGNEVLKIKMPHYFAQSIKLRSDLLENAVRTIQQVYDLRRMQQFHDTIINAIAEESPETALKITERLAALNSEVGITIEGFV